MCHRELERSDQEIKDDLGEAIGKDEPMNQSELEMSHLGNQQTKEKNEVQRNAKENYQDVKIDLFFFKFES